MGEWNAPEGARAASAPSQFISFAIGDDQYGVDIMAVREIKGWSEITHLPKQPDYVRGVLNLRGVIVPIIDLRCRFGQGLTEATGLHIVIIVQIGSRPVGLLAIACSISCRLTRARSSRCRASRAAAASTSSPDWSPSRAR
jgi:purine-binding chemotaxis protein CheW